MALDVRQIFRQTRHNDSYNEFIEFELVFASILATILYKTKPVELLLGIVKAIHRTVLFNNKERNNNYDTD